MVITNMTTTITSYGSQVQTSADTFVRDAVFSERLMVKESSDVTVNVSESSYVLNGAETQECTRFSHTFNHSNVSGDFVVRCLQNGTSDPILTTTLETNPSETNIVCDGIKSTISKGLSFDSNDSSIFFGASKVFRIKYTSDTPERLLFQYLDTDSGTYVTKFSCAKS